MKKLVTKLNAVSNVGYIICGVLYIVAGISGLIIEKKK